MNDLLPKQIEYAESGLTIPETMTLELWLETGKGLSTIRKAIPFWYGDFLNFGESRFGEDFAQAFDPHGDEYKFVKQVMWVAKRVPKNRRRPGLSWYHHKEVADLDPEEQEKLLTRAEQLKLSVSKFRKIVYQQTLALDLPEKTPQEIAVAQVPSRDFVRVEKVVDIGVKFLEALQGITGASLEVRAQGFLVSHLKDIVKEVGAIMLEYEKQTLSPKAVGDAAQDQKVDPEA